MQVDLFQSGTCRQLQHGVDVVFVAVHAAGGKQAHDMQCRAALLGGFDGLDEHGVAVEAAVLDGQVDLGQILVDHAPGADVQMAHFRIAHLTFGQADVELGGVDERVRILFPEFVPVRLAGVGDGIEIGILAIAEAIQDEQKNGGDRLGGEIGHAGFCFTKIS